MTEKIVVVAGASGVLGEDIVNALLQKPNVKVRILTRPQSAAKLTAFQDQGAEIVAVNLEHGSSKQLASALAGAFAFVSALNGGHEVIVGAQTRLLQAAKQAGVRRFIPSSFSYNIFGMDDGDNPNTDERREFAKIADRERGTVEVVHILNGAFLDKRIVFGFLGAFDLQQGQALLWGDGDAVTDVTTYWDTARFTAEAAVDESPVPKVLEVAGETLSFNALVKAYEEASGKTITIVNQGSMADLDQEIARRRAAEPDNFYAWLPLMYYRGSFGGKGKLKAIANSRYPNIQPESVREYVRREQL